MNTMKKKGVLTVFGILMACLSAVCFSISQQGSGNRYDIRPEITLPESKTDVARMIDAYERLMDNYRELMENNLTGVRTEVATTNQKLDSIDRKMSLLSAQLETIQKKLGIELSPQQPEKQMSIQDLNRTDKTGSENPK